MARQRNAEILAGCNTLVRTGGCETWSAARLAEDGFYDARGLRIADPTEWRPASLEDILNYYDTAMLSAVAAMG